MPETLFDGVPDHLQQPLTEWIIQYLERSPELVQRIALRLRLPLQTPDVRELVDAVLAREAQELLDVVDLAIQLDTALHWDLDVRGMEDNTMEASLAAWIPKWRWPKNSRAAALEQLACLLADAGSALQVDWKERHLRRRVDITVATAAEHTMTLESHQHLRDAWTAIYGRHPDPAKAYDEAVRAVEAAAIPIVLPNGGQETLGKVLSHLQDARDKWELAVEGKTHGAIDPLVAMIKMLWHGHTGRHSGGPTFRPQRLDEAQMAVHLAVTLVHWFSTDAIRRRQRDQNTRSEPADVTESSPAVGQL